MKQDGTLKQILAEHKIGFVVGDKDVEEHMDNLLSALNAYISKEVKAARKDEINYVIGFGERGGHDVYCRTIGEAVIKRRKELE